MPGHTYVLYRYAWRMTASVAAAEDAVAEALGVPPGRGSVRSFLSRRRVRKGSLSAFRRKLADNMTDVDFLEACRGRTYVLYRYARRMAGSVAAAEDAVAEAPGVPPGRGSVRSFLSRRCIRKYDESFLLSGAN